MKVLAVFRKSLLEMRRDLAVVLLTLIAAPFFILLYRFAFGSEFTVYTVLVQDRGGGAAVVQAMGEITYKNGQPMLKPVPVTDRAAAETKLRNREAAALVVFGPGEAVELVGDLGNPRYTVAAIFVYLAIEKALEIPNPYPVKETALGASDSRTEFEAYVPGLLVFAVVMLIYPAAMAVTREMEAGTMRRLLVTRMTALDLLGGITASQMLLGVGSLLLALVTARGAGFTSQGPLWAAIAVGGLTSLAMIGAGLLVACFAKSVNEAYVIGTFPLMLMMFFSGAMFPLAPAPLFTLGGRTIGLYDALPPTHAVVALNKIFTFGAGVGEVAFELWAVGLLSLLYFGLGVWLFQRRVLRGHG